MDLDSLPKPASGFPGATQDGYGARIAASGDPTADSPVRHNGWSADSVLADPSTESRRDAIQTVSDGTLIEAVLVGDASQFEALVRRYSHGIYRFLLKHVGSAALAEDLAQETFVEAYRHLATFKGEAKFSTWLYGIALNRLRNYLNR